jgi:excisionase family DNA binding protein|tara:strand:+ start:212 stop:403 length:192 start_codon:yes stop_codon:yes gene_type:complete
MMEKLLSTSDVCDILGLTNKTVLKYIKQGKLSPIRLNKRVFRYRPSEVMSLLDTDTLEPVGHS